MRRRTFLIGLGSSVLLGHRCFAQATTIDHAVAVGDSRLTLREYARGLGPTFVRVHQNETPAALIGRRVVEELGGRFFDLIHDGNRRVTFRQSGTTYTVDPNRIYTVEGIAHDLARATASAGAAPRLSSAIETARASAAIAGSAILDLCGRGPLIALHNNAGPGANGGGFGIGWYMPGGREYKGEVLFVGDIDSFGNVSGEAKRYQTVNRRLVCTIKYKVNSRWSVTRGIDFWLDGPAPVFWETGCGYSRLSWGVDAAHLRFTFVRYGSSPYMSDLGDSPVRKVRY